MAAWRPRASGSSAGVAPVKSTSVLRHQCDDVFKPVCQFLDREQRRGTIHEARPNACRRFPSGPTRGDDEFVRFERQLQDDESVIASA
jgi:Fe-S-cluster containining protein